MHIQTILITISRPNGRQYTSLGGWVRLTVIIGLVSVQLALNLPTGTELGNTFLKDGLVMLRIIL